ncbi:MAG: TonB-dependent receptor [Porphyromonadaceae bacterium]|nr:TonB-dependent receptor [Porphyromonadaceae bacterium]
MKKIIFVLFLFVIATLHAFSQTGIRGVVKVENSEEPLPRTTVTVMQQNFSANTNAAGEFVITFLEPGEADVQFSRSGYLPRIVSVTIVEGEETDLGAVYLEVDVQEEARQEAILQLTESDFSEDEGRASQSISGSLSRGDVYLSQTSFSFSPMRFRLRGYEQEFESTYINGVHFNTLDRGGFNYSSLGGLNDAMRNKDIVVGLESNSFSYGNLGSNVNIINRASVFAAGTKVSASYTNRMYKLRGQATYATGVLPNGWAFAASGLFRWADEGISQGTFYNSAGYFLAAEKIFNPRHSLSLVTYGAPTQRAQQSATTQEAYDLTGSIYYNTYWGYQNGKKRNSRVVKTFDPTAILTHDFKIDDKQRLRSGIAFHYSHYSNSALAFYNAPDPRPDYYQYMPSFQNQAADSAAIADMWRFEKGKPVYPNISQVDWHALYDANLRNNVSNPNGTAKYVVERRHSNLMETAFNSNYTNQLTRILKLTAGVEAKIAKDMNYKTMDDLLGGNQWIDIDQFAERDLTGILEGMSDDVIQNDLNNPNRVIKKGDKFGYNYDINVLHTSGYLQNEWNWNKLELNYAAKVTYTQFNRVGHMRNGRAPENSFGASKVLWFFDPSLKAGATYKLDGRNRITANVLAETRAPLPYGAYVSERIKDTHVPNLTNRQILSYDLSYAFLYPFIRGKIAAFQTHINRSTESLGYYDDEERTFINYLLSDVNKVYRGVEVGVTVKLNTNFSVSAAGTYADYRYTNNSTGTLSFENGAQPDRTNLLVLTKNLKINTGPQTAFNVTLDYFHPKMWFADITLNYFDNNFLDFAPSRFTAVNYGNVNGDFYQQDNLNYVWKKSLDENGNFSESKFTELMNDKNFKSTWGLAEDQSIEWGRYGGLVREKDKDGKVTRLAMSEVRQKLGVQEKLKAGFLVDVSVGKLIYLKDRRSLNLNLSLSNILNNTNMITGGFQQGRIPIDAGTKQIDTSRLNYFPNKYYYAWGFNLFFNIGYKF